MAIPIIAGIAAGYVMASSSEQPAGHLAASSLTGGGSPVLGDESASVTILEWGDYQCTFCFKFHSSSLEVLKRDYIEAGRAKLVFKDFPLNGPDSVLAAEATYCAEDQGRYWQYHDALYSGWAGERTGWINMDSLGGFAESAGLDTSEFYECMDEKRHAERVQDLWEFGRATGIDATPSFFIFNDEEIIKIRGNQPLEAFVQAIDELDGS